MTVLNQSNMKCIKFFFLALLTIIVTACQKPSEEYQMKEMASSKVTISGFTGFEQYQTITLADEVEEQIKYFNWSLDWGKEDEIRLNEMLKDKVFIYSTWLEDGVRENMMIKEYWGEYEIEGKKHKYNVAEKSEKRNQVTEGLIYPKTQNKYSLF